LNTYRLKEMIKWHFRQCRKQYNCSSLLRTSLSIQQITQKLNFSDQSAFGKFFQRHSGISPAHFRRQ
jgi:AraC-like DNA-binding protein